MTPLQAFKARCVPGAKLVFQAFWCKTPTVRAVATVKATQVSFFHPTKATVESWIGWPRASEITEPSSGLFVLRFSDVKDAFIYDFNVGSDAVCGAQLTDRDYSTYL
jgi:hypothetical protein